MWVRRKFVIVILVIKNTKKTYDYLFFIIMDKKKAYSLNHRQIGEGWLDLISDSHMSVNSRFSIICPSRRHVIVHLWEGFKVYHLVRPTWKRLDSHLASQVFPIQVFRACWAYFSTIIGLSWRKLDFLDSRISSIFGLALMS